MNFNIKLALAEACALPSAILILYRLMRDICTADTWRNLCVGAAADTTADDDAAAGPAASAAADEDGWRPARPTSYTAEPRPADAQLQRVAGRRPRKPRLWLAVVHRHLTLLRAAYS